MPAIQTSPDRETAAHLMARARTALAMAQVRAAKVAGREPNLITTFALHAEIEAMEADATVLMRCAEVVAATALRNAIKRLRALCPEN